MGTFRLRGVLKQQSRRDHVGYDDDYTGMERFFAMEIEEVGAIVGDKRVLLLADNAHQLPIL